MLATLTRAPSVFSPRRDLLRAQQRASLVLDSMVDDGAITQAEADEARAHPATIIDRASVDARNYYLDAAADEATKLATINGQAPTADMVVHTTLEPKVQEAARLAAVRTIDKYGKKSHVSEAAVVMMKLDGGVVAMIGGVDYQTRCSTAPPRRIASPARPSSPSSIWRRWNRASRPGRRATTRRSISTAIPPPISAASHTAR